MTRHAKASRPTCQCGHTHHSSDDLATIGDQWRVCRCARCWVSVLVAARIGTQLRIFDLEQVR